MSKIKTNRTKMKRIQNTAYMDSVKLALDFIQQGYKKFSSEVTFIECTLSPISAAPGYFEWLNGGKSLYGKGNNKKQFDSSPGCIKKRLPTDPTPGQISELILSLEVDYPEEARQLALAVLLAPSFPYLDSYESECFLSLFLKSQRGNLPDFFQNWRKRLSEPIGDRYINFIYEIHGKKNTMLDMEEWKVETILKAEFSPCKKSTIGESYELAQLYLQGNKYNNYKPILRRWIKHLEDLFKVKYSVPMKNIDQLRSALKVEFDSEASEHSNKIRVSRGHKSEYAIDQVTAAIIVLEFAEKLYLHPYDSKYLEGLLSLWIALSISKEGSQKRIDFSEIRTVNKCSPIIESVKRLNEKIMSVGDKDLGLWNLVDMYQSSTNSKKSFPNLTKAILKNQIKNAQKKCGGHKLGKISENVLKSFPHPFRSLRVPHVDLYGMRADSISDNEKKAGRLLLSFLGMPCMDMIKQKHISDIGNNS